MKKIKISKTAEKEKGWEYGETTVLKTAGKVELLSESLFNEYSILSATVLATVFLSYIYLLYR